MGQWVQSSCNPKRDMKAFAYLPLSLALAQGATILVKKYKSYKVDPAAFILLETIANSKYDIFMHYQPLTVDPRTGR